MVDTINKILILGKMCTGANYEKLDKAFSYIENNLIDSDGNM